MKIISNSKLKTIVILTFATFVVATDGYARQTEVNFFNMMSKFDRKSHKVVQGRDRVGYYNEMTAAQRIEYDKKTAPAPSDPNKKVRFIANIETEYQSNIFWYSEDDIDNFKTEDGRRDTQFRDVVTIDDWVSTLDVGVEYTNKWIPGTKTVLRQRAYFNRYDDNTDRNYEIYNFGAKHYFTRNDILRIDYYRVPDFYVRTLLDEDVSAYRRAHFDKDTIQFLYWKRFDEKLRGRFIYRNDDKNYNEDFNERDSSTNSINIALIYPDPFPNFWKNMKLTWFYEFAGADARGEDLDAAIDQDLSHVRNGIGIKTKLPIGERWFVEPHYRVDFKDFTTNNSVVDDPLHRDREDTIINLGIKAQYELTPEVDLFVKYSFEENSAELSPDAGTTTLDDIVGYKNHSVSFGAKAKY